MVKTLIVLVSNGSGNRQQTANQDRASIWWKDQGIEPELVDGVAEKERRNELFGISGTRGNYPQFFLRENEDDSIEFLGLFDDIEAMNDDGTFTKEALGLSEEEEEQREPENSAEQSRALIVAMENAAVEELCWGCGFLSWFPTLRYPVVASAN